MYSKIILDERKFNQEVDQKLYCVHNKKCYAVVKKTMVNVTSSYVVRLDQSERPNDVYSR